MTDKKTLEMVLELQEIVRQLSVKVDTKAPMGNVSMLEQNTIPDAFFRIQDHETRIMKLEGRE